MVLHSEALEDKQFAEDLINRLEFLGLKSKYKSIGLFLISFIISIKSKDTNKILFINLIFIAFVPQRDLVAGTVHDAVSFNIIKKRCRKILALFSLSFLNSEEGVLLTTLAQCHDQELTSRIIQIFLNPHERYDIPPKLQEQTKLVYNPKARNYNFWQRLIRDTLRIQGTLRRDIMEYSIFRPN